MRDVIARALVWVLRMVLPVRGRHGARPVTEPAPSPDPAPTRSGLTSTSAQWLTPTPEHVRALRAPLRGEDVVLVRPYVLAATPHAVADMQVVPGVVHERQRAAALATLGVDYPYTYPGAPFTRSAFAAAGVPA
ncbi:hypothetical protein QNO07_02220 [Streptomyces sp. 549]|uniref:hypothetical protein n=1 Tax=Streptomyces sp. 549 TaxID=3049076 RepID=UPI0024C46FA0|nr:hypothetical protein [Streptomyces sp. 549]MDK1472252.1 hypothetical protein [Streptomyces sp. 549]